MEYHSPYVSEHNYSDYRAHVSGPTGPTKTTWGPYTLLLDTSYGFWRSKVARLLMNTDITWSVEFL